MTKKTYFVDTGRYTKSLKCKAFSVLEAKRIFHRKLLELSFEDFCSYINLMASKDRSKYE